MIRLFLGSMAIGSLNGENSGMLHLVQNTSLYRTVDRPDHIYSVFRQAKESAKAMLAYEKSLDWQEVFEIAVQESLSEDELKDIGYRVAGTCFAKFLI